LGKGASALFADEKPADDFEYEIEDDAEPQARPKKPALMPPVQAEASVPLSRLRANPGQPRKNFDEAALAELAESIKLHGLIEPIVADEDSDGGLVIVAGERRARAAKIAGLKEVPVVVRKYSSRERLEIALVENIHRADLNPIEEAQAFRQIMEAGGLTQDEVAARVGKKRTTVANSLRLLKLPEKMRAALEDGSLTAGHARAVLSLQKEPLQEKLFAEIIAKGLSVRAAEERAAELSGPGKAKKGGEISVVTTSRRDPQLKAMEEKLIEKLGTKVVIAGNLKKGRVEIDYFSMDDLDRLYNLIGK
jgi:ParB family chromosome partitioning protein